MATIQVGTQGHAARQNHCFVERKSGRIRPHEGPGKSSLTISAKPGWGLGWVSTTRFKFLSDTKFHSCSYRFDQSFTVNWRRNVNRTGYSGTGEPMMGASYYKSF